MSKRKIQRKNYSPFKIPPLSHGNIALNFTNDPENDFMIYADSFYETAKTLRDKLKSEVGYLDSDACPIVFLYRHALELYVKDMLIIGEKILALEKMNVPIKKAKILSTHSLSKLIPSLKIIFKEARWEWDLGINGSKDFRNFIESIDKIDPKSNAFRYPINSNSSASLPKHFGFNILEFSYMMDKILDLLSGGCLGLRKMLELTYLESLSKK